MQAITIRPMKEEDISAISAIVCSGYELLSQKEGYMSEETNRLISERGSIEAIISQKRESQFFVAEIEGKAVGVVAISKNIIEKLYVAPEQHGLGIGKTLFNFSEKYIAEQGCTEISLGAFPSSAGFYKAMGMEYEGEKIAPSGPIKGRTIMLFRKRLA